MSCTSNPQNEVCSSYKFLAVSKLKTSANGNFSEAEMVQFFFERVENIVEKGENCGLPKGFFPRVVKS